MMLNYKNLVLFCLIFCLEISSDLVGANPLKGKDTVYSVVIDAGSTGSRVVAYEFKKDGKKLTLCREKFFKEKPGLSSYANNPEEGARKIIELLKKADDFVPEEEKPKTRLWLRATAGLRLLGEEKAQQMLHVVQKHFKRTKYRVGKYAAGMLSGSDEGVFAWFTLNYLKGTLDNKTLAALEMGGGSAQVTYVPKPQYRTQLKKDMHRVPYKNLTVFSKSYLGLGLSAARDRIFQAMYKDTIKVNQTVQSSCIHPDIRKAEFVFGTTRYYISGVPSKKKQHKRRRETCQRRVRDHVLPIIDPKPLGLDEEDSVALSAFYYRGLAAKLIVDEGGKTTLIQLWKKAGAECAKPNEKDPFLCMDLVYMYTLLKEGFGLKDTNQIEMVLKLDDHELSWALGFAYSKIMKDQKTNKETKRKT